MLDVFVNLFNDLYSIGTDAWAKFINDEQAVSLAMAGFVVGGAGSFLYSLRSIPGQFFNWVKRMSTTELMIRSSSEKYIECQEFILDKVVWTSLSRRFIFHNEGVWERRIAGAADRSVNVTLSAGYGKHLGRWGKTFVIVDREKEEASNTDEFKETITLTFFTRNKDVLKEFSAAVEQAIKAKTSNTVRIRNSSGGGWSGSKFLPPRRISTVFTSDQQAERLLAHVRSHTDSREYCHSRGLPWHSGALLTGEPGTGKTSLIHAIATETGKEVAYLSLGATKGDDDLADLIGEDLPWHNTLLVIEDADVAGAQVDRDQARLGGVTLSGMLNTLDGLMTPDGVYVIATTNHPETLDPALTRPGRFDLRLDLGKLGLAEAERMARLLDLGDEWDQHREEIERRYTPKTGAWLRAAFLETGVTELLKD